MPATPRKFSCEARFCKATLPFKPRVVLAALAVQVRSVVRAILEMLLSLLAALASGVH